jgi:hypothetical protein
MAPIKRLKPLMTRSKTVGDESKAFYDEYTEYTRMRSEALLLLDGLRPVQEADVNFGVRGSAAT